MSVGYFPMYRLPVFLVLCCLIVAPMTDALAVDPKVPKQPVDVKAFDCRPLLPDGLSSFQVIFTDQDGKSLAQLPYDAPIQIEFQNPASGRQPTRDSISVAIYTSEGALTVCNAIETGNQTGIFHAEIRVTSQETDSVPSRMLLVQHTSVVYILRGDADASVEQVRVAGFQMRPSTEPPGADISHEMRRYHLIRALCLLGTTDTLLVKKLVTERCLTTAVPLLTDMLKTDQDPDHQHECLLLLGQAAHARGDVTAAVAYLNQLLDTAPKDRHIPDALLTLQRIALDQGKVAHAEALFHRLYTDWTTSSQAYSADVTMGEYFFQKADYSAAIARFQETMTRWPDHPGIVAVAFRIPTSYHRIGLKGDAAGYEQAATHYLAFAARSGDKGSLGENALYMAASCYQRLDQNEKALQVIDQLLAAKPTSSMRTSAELLRSALKRDIAQNTWYTNIPALTASVRWQWGNIRPAVGIEFPQLWALSADGTYLAVHQYFGSTLNGICLWNMAERHPYRTIQHPTTIFQHICQTRSLAISPDNQFVAYSTEDHICYIHRIRDGAEVKRLTGFPATVTGMAFSPDSRLLALSAGGEIQLVQVGAWTVQRRLQTSGSQLCFSPDSRLLYVKRNQVTCWRITDGARIRVLDIGDVPLEISPDGLYMVAKRGERNQERVSVVRLEDDHVICATDDGDFCLAFSADGTMLASAAYAEVRIRRLPDGTIIQRFPILQGHALSSLGFTPDKQYVICGYEDSLQFHRVSDGTSAYEISSRQFDFTAFTYAPTDHLVATGDTYGIITLWSAATGLYLHRLEADTKAVRAVAFLNQEMLACAGDAGSVRIIPLRTLGATRTLTGSQGKLRCLAISPNKQYIAAGGSEKKIYLWRWPDGQLLETFTGHTDTITSIAFSPNGLLLASTSDDQTCKIWRIAAAEADASYSIGEGVKSVAFSPDNRLLAISGARMEVIQVENGHIAYQEPNPNSERGVFASNGHILAFTRPREESCYIQLLNDQTWKSLGQISGVMYGGGRYLEFSADNRYILCGGPYGLGAWPVP